MLPRRPTPQARKLHEQFCLAGLFDLVMLANHRALPCESSSPLATMSRVAPPPGTHPTRLTPHTQRSRPPSAHLRPLARYLHIPHLHISPRIRLGRNSILRDLRETAGSGSIRAVRRAPCRERPRTGSAVTEETTSTSVSEPAPDADLVVCVVGKIWLNSRLEIESL